MAKKKDQKLLADIVSVLIVLGVISAALWISYRGVVSFFHTADCFKIVSITVDSSLSFLDKQELSKLYGKNIFTLDIEGFHQRLGIRYPQMNELRVVRRFPNQISIVAKKRKPALQLEGRNKILVVDEQGVILSSINKVSEKLPLIKGVKSAREPSVGKVIQDGNLKAALSIISFFSNEVSLRPYQILRMDVTNLSKISLDLSNGLNIIVDSLRVEHNIKVLGMLLSQGKLNPAEIKYIDLRFKEPVVGKRESEKPKI
jgi:cell division septal protein FtsQ